MGDSETPRRSKVLEGHKILLTREYTEDYRALGEQGAELLVIPTIQAAPPGNYEELDRAIANIGQYNWLVFTSRNGVRFFLDRLLENRGNLHTLSGLRVCAVGSGTAEALERYGLKTDLIPKRFNAEGLVEAFTQPADDSGYLEGVSFLFPRAEAARDIFPSKVRELGGTIDTPVAYRTVAPGIDDSLRESMLHASITIAAFTSGSTFSNFIEIAGPDALPFLSRIVIAVIGPVTRQTVEEAGLQVTIMPPKATIKAMVEAIIQWAKEL